MRNLSRPQFNRRGEPKYDYTRSHALTRDGRLVEITGWYRDEDETPQARLRFFNGEDAGEHPLALLRILMRG
jgi:hypothetical protein